MSTDAIFEEHPHIVNEVLSFLNSKADASNKIEQSSKCIFEDHHESVKKREEYDAGTMQGESSSYVNEPEELQQKENLEDIQKVFRVMIIKDMDEGYFINPSSTNSETCLESDLISPFHLEHLGFPKVEELEALKDSNSLTYGHLKRYYESEDASNCVSSSTSKYDTFDAKLQQFIAQNRDADENLIFEFYCKLASEGISLNDHKRKITSKCRRRELSDSFIDVLFRVLGKDEEKLRIALTSLLSIESENLMFNRFLGGSIAVHDANHFRELLCENRHVKMQNAEKLPCNKKRELSEDDEYKLWSIFVTLDEFKVHRDLLGVDRKEKLVVNKTKRKTSNSSETKKKGRFAAKAAAPPVAPAAPSIEKASIFSFANADDFLQCFYEKIYTFNVDSTVSRECKIEALDFLLRHTHDPLKRFADEGNSRCREYLKLWEERIRKGDD